MGSTDLPDLSPHGYRVIGELSRGGFGRVYLAHSERMNRQVAVKEMLERAEQEQSGEQVDSAEYRDRSRRFAQEGEMAGKFGDNPHIVTVHDFIDQRYLVLHYYKDGTLRDRLETVGALPLDEALVVAIGLCHALEDLWREYIVHRDVKPENTFLVLKRRDDGSSVVTRAALGDFGIAQTRKHTGQMTFGLKHPGTPDYMSPEQDNGTQYLDVRSDLYAVGLILYEMLYGRRYKGSEHYLRGQAVPDEEHAYVGSILNKLLQKDVQARYSTPEDL
ncbi:MAG: serine/threonine protein kinase, partial [Candidatus Promineofilum sp.]|nr:serine/threonine protein kinase [Promineifilum sp.]